ncbi:MAG: N-acetyltransferase [Chloroflexi bacterium]|nr:MAG: N-acetyltransferase [Chloroflexota bacterium]
MKVLDFDFDRDLLKRFLDFPQRLYASDPNWLPDPGEERLLTDGFSSSLWRNFLVLNGNEIVGRVTAIVNPLLRDEHGQPYGQLGFFDCIDDLQAAQLMVDGALTWLRSKLGPESTIFAPMNFDTWHPYRLRAKGFDQPTFLMEPHNPAYYPTLLERLGFAPITRYVTKTVNDLEPSLSVWDEFHSRAISWGYSVRTFSPADAFGEMSLVYRLSTDMFRENYYFTDISENEFRALYAGAAGRLDPDLFLFIIDPQQNPVGLCYSFVDHRMTGTVNVKTFGVLPHVRGEGVGAALAYEVYRRFQQKGFKCVNHCLMRAGNRADKFDGGLGEVTREYTLYTRQLRS